MLEWNQELGDAAGNFIVGQKIRFYLELGQKKMESSLKVGLAN